MFIEDLIQTVSGGGFSFITSAPNIDTSEYLSTREEQILFSMADQLSMGNALTEKQAFLALRLLDKCKDGIRARYNNIDSILANPSWKLPFRTLATTRTIKIKSYSGSLAEYANHTCIHVEFPFDANVVELFKTRNQELNSLHKGTWDPSTKNWIFRLTERNLIWLGDSLLNQEFQADSLFVEYYNSLVDVRKNMEDYLPMLVKTNGKYSIRNSHGKIPELDANNLVEALFFARDYGITVWDDAIETEIKTDVNPHTLKILTSTYRNRPWINSDDVSIEEAFTDLLNYGGPLLLVVPGGSELALTKAWTKFAISQGISTKDISVMFRLPNDQAAFNQYVKETGINNPVSDNTKIVFVSTKITKPLVKSGVKFNTVINLGYYNYMHFTIQTMVENAPILVYYNIKEPTNKRWLPQEL